ncbi:MAG: rhodanese-like domain-containing protein [Dehalococcoidia bacterium]
MVTLVSADWVERNVGSPEVLILDPRRPMKYLQGHVKNAVNIPILGAFDSQARLLSPDDLQRWIGAVGLDDQKTPVLYDSHDGQNGAMLAWILEYLGRTDVHLMDAFFEKWRAQGREIFYRPVKPVAKEFKAQVNPKVRATLEDIGTDSGLKLIDFRSRDEYRGELDTDERPGHVPGAMNIVWLDLLGADNQYLASKEELKQLFTTAGIRNSDKIVGYCRTGPRAAIGYIALQQLGYNVCLYDGSYAEWARSGRPVETSEIGQI